MELGDFVDNPQNRTQPEHGAPAPDLTSVWRHLVDDLPPSQRAWLAASQPVTLHEHTAIIAVADDFTRNQLEGRLRTRLEDALGNAFGTQIRIAVTVDPELGGALGGHPDGGRSTPGADSVAL